MKNNFLYNILNRGCQAGLVLTPVFVLYRELKSILPFLITSRKKQKPTTKPNDLLHIQSCSDLRVSTGTAFYLFSLCNNGTMQGVTLG